MKRILIILWVLVLAFALSACAEDNKPVDATKVPELTTEPTNVPTEVPDLNPGDTPDLLEGGEDFSMLLENGAEYFLDFDGDDLADSVLFTDRAPVENEHELTVTITRGVDPDNPYEYITGCTWGCAWIIDSDPEDGKLEVLVTDDGASGDPRSAILRISDDGNEIKELMTGGVRLDGDDPASFAFSSDNGFDVICESFILGCNYLSARIRAAANGIVLMSEGYAYSEPREYTLKKDLPVKLQNDDGTDGEAYIVSAGNTITPVYADNFTNEATFVIVRLGDGKLANIEVVAGVENGYTINGVDQFEYADFPDED